MTASVVEKAMRISAVAHKDQKRKEGDVPYITHPAMVALLLARNGFRETVVAAGLVHDVVEDSGISIEVLERELGSEVAAIVASVSENKDLVWEERKTQYVKSIREGNEDVKAVSIADKIHNLECLLLAYAKEGDAVWSLFNRGMEKKMWFEKEMLTMFQETWAHPLVARYAELLEELKIAVAKTS